MEKIQLLLVEDEPSDSDLIVEHLSESEDIDFVVSLSRTIRDATDELKHKTFDIILLDLGLPDSTGLDSITELYKSFFHIPILVITGFGYEKLGRESISIGAQWYITKSKLNSLSLVNAIMFSIERHQHLLKIRKSEEELEENNLLLSEALASKNRMFSIIGHDLKSPFNSLLGLLNILHADYKGLKDEERASYIKSCLETAENTNKLIENLLDWARSQSDGIQFHPERVHLGQIANNVLPLLIQGAEKKQIDVQIHASEEVVLLADTNSLETVVRNLLSNAIKFSNRGGTVCMKVVKIDDNAATLCVEDNGIGVSRENKSKLFDIGEVITTRGTANEQGTGMGLLLCKDFIHLNGGEIWMESEKNKGTRVFFTLPLASPPKSHSPGMSEKHMEPGEGAKKKILLVEDDDGFRMYLRTLFESEGIEIIEATNGAEAIKSVIENDYISLIMMDIKMPVMDGLDATKEIRKIHPNLPIIALTAFAHLKNDIENDSSYHFDDFFIKSVQKEALISLVRKHLQVQTR